MRKIKNCLNRKSKVSKTKLPCLTTRQPYVFKYYVYVFKIIFLYMQMYNLFGNLQIISSKFSRFLSFFLKLASKYMFQTANLPNLCTLRLSHTPNFQPQRPCY